MSDKRYKYCYVHLCENNNKKNPEKVFINVPKSKLMREKWLELAWRDPQMRKDLTVLHFCEDHFNVSFIYLIYIFIM